MHRTLLALLLALPASMMAQQNLGPITAPRINFEYYAGSILYPTIQSAVTAACASSAGGVVIKGYGVTTTDTPTAATGGCTKVEILDQSTVFTSYYAWSGSAYAAAPETLTGALVITGPAGVGAGYLTMVDGTNERVISPGFDGINYNAVTTFNYNTNSFSYILAHNSSTTAASDTVR